MTSRTDVPFLFLLTVTVSVVATSTAYWQEIHLDVVPSKNVHDGGDSSWRDVDDAVPPPHSHHPPRRERRMLTDFDRQTVINTLNRLRRSLGAPNMYYAVCYVFLFSFYPLLCIVPGSVLPYLTFWAAMRVVVRTGSRQLTGLSKKSNPPIVVKSSNNTDWSSEFYVALSSEHLILNSVCRMQTDDIHRKKQRARKYTIQNFISLALYLWYFNVEIPKYFNLCIR